MEPCIAKSQKNIFIFILFFQSQRLKLVPPRTLVDVHLSRNRDSCTKILQVSGGICTCAHRGDGAAAAAQILGCVLFWCWNFCFVLFLSVSIR
jgi:hypothetical protein